MNRRTFLFAFALAALGGGCWQNRPATAPAPIAALAPATLAVEPFGTLPDGRPVTRYTLANGRGMTARILDLGCIIAELQVPDRQGRTVNVVAGSDQLEWFTKGGPAANVVGRFANRIANATFTLDGQEFAVTRNAGKHHIHGGREGFERKLWAGRIVKASGPEVSLELTYHSADGEEGFPGNLAVTVTYTLNQDNELRVNYRARTDKPTPLNLTNHAYFNLAGSGDILDHIVTINSDRFLQADNDRIPTGEIASLDGMAMDFRKPTAVGARYLDTGLKPSGYDFTYVLPPHGAGELVLAARAEDPKSGRTLEVRTNEQAVQLYTANHFSSEKPVVSLGGVTYGRHGTLCFESERFPDAVNHPNFPSCVLRPGETLDSITVFRFGAK